MKCLANFVAQIIVICISKKSKYKITPRIKSKEDKDTHLLQQFKLRMFLLLIKLSMDRLRRIKVRDSIEFISKPKTIWPTYIFYLNCRLFPKQLALYSRHNDNGTEECQHKKEYYTKKTKVDKRFQETPSNKLIQSDLIYK